MSRYDEIETRKQADETVPLEVYQKRVSLHHDVMTERTEYKRLYENAVADRDRQKARAEKAEQTLLNAGYTYNGGELWKPPLGKIPDFDLIDRYKTRLEVLENDLINANMNLEIMTDRAEVLERALRQTSGCNSCIHPHAPNVTSITFVGQKVCCDCGEERRNWQFYEARFEKNV